MPPKLPNAQKVLRGTYRPSRDNRAAPKPKAETPRPPDWLDARGVAMWAELVAQLEPMRCLTTADRTALGLLADAGAEYLEAREAVRAHGMTYAKRSRGRPALTRPRPEVAIAQAARRDMMTLLDKFGLTPTARPRVAADPEADDDAERFLFGRYWDGIANG